MCGWGVDFFYPRSWQGTSISCPYLEENDAILVDNLKNEE